MAYTAEAAARRRCTGTRKDGEPCRGWAVWDEPEGRQLCVNHAGRGHRGPQTPERRFRSYPTNYTPCSCRAYAWPHRPGGGLCRWPEPPLYRCTTPAGTRPSGRLPRWVKLLARHRGWKW